MDPGDGSIQQDLDVVDPLPLLDPLKSHRFIIPVKRINEVQDVHRFLTSRAYDDIGKFLMLLNYSMCPRRFEADGKQQIKAWDLEDPGIGFSTAVQRIQRMLDRIDSITDEVLPDTGPRRFGNVSFRKWHSVLESRVTDLLTEHLPASVTDGGRGQEVTAREELTPYLLGGFGSAQRLDYGTGHELSFLAFLGCIWELGGFHRDTIGNSSSDIGRTIVIGIIEPYLRIIRRLILTYTLEPAGSHGVWGLDDHSFLPYIFGSAQYCPAIKDGEKMPIEGSLRNSPKPGDIAKKTVVDRERKSNMYFAAVGFINDVKTGPFWEHSPILFDISGVRSGWGKINKGMLKMYNAEVLSKFPVVQHFPFGSLFSWDENPAAPRPLTTVHTSIQPSMSSIFPTVAPENSSKDPQLSQESTKAPWAR